MSWKVGIPQEMWIIHPTLLVGEAEGTVTAAGRLCNTIPLSEALSCVLPLFPFFRFFGF